MQYIRNSILQGANYSVSKRFVDQFGIVTAIVLTDLIEQFYFFKDVNLTIISKNEHFMSIDHERVEKKFRITTREQNSSIGELKKHGIVKAKRIDGKVRMTICEKEIAMLINSDGMKAHVTNVEPPEGSPAQKVERKMFIPPTEQEVVEYFRENGYLEEAAKKAFKYYEIAKWEDSSGKKVKNWKQKMISVWFKTENKHTVEVKEKIVI